MKCVLPQKSPGSSPNVRRKSALKIDTATASARFKAAAATNIEAAASARFNAAAAAAAAVVATTTTTCVSSYGSNATLPNHPTPSASAAAAAAVSATSSTMARSEPAAATVPNRPRPQFSDERRPSIWEIFEDSLPKITVEKY